MPQPSRRQFLASAIGTSAIALSGTSVAAVKSRVERKFTIDLTPGAIGVKADQVETIRLAAAHGFESVYPNSGQLASMNDQQLKSLQSMLNEHDLAWGASGLSVDFRKDANTFRDGLKQLPQHAAALQKAGVTRVGTWLRPYSDELTYVANFRQHAKRLRECVKVLNDHGLRFGMEYVGPKTLWASARYSFIHSMAETKDLIEEINQPNVGFVLDSWHWYTAQETIEDLLSLQNKDVIACDLNDAPAGIAVDEQIDNRRLLPTHSGVIDLKTFLGALVKIGYDGPVRAEPFNADLNALDNEAACAATSKALHAAMDLVGG